MPETATPIPVPAGAVLPPEDPERLRISVVICNYNYGRYLPRAIESVLEEEPGAEIIVVDDFSTDDSREIIAAYAHCVTAILPPENGGQSIAFNLGYAAVTGDIVYYLDADDFVLPGAFRRLREIYHPACAAYFFPLCYADPEGQLSGGQFPPKGTPLPEGDLAPVLSQTGRVLTPVTSGMVFARWAMDRIMPIDTALFDYGADGYLGAAIPFCGPIRSSSEAIGVYRLHGKQHSNRRAGYSAYAKLARWRMVHDAGRYEVIRRGAAARGLTPAPDLGERDALHQLERLISLVYEPDQHPKTGERARDPLRKLRSIYWREKGKTAKLRFLYFCLLTIAPAGEPRRRLLQLRIDASSRPKWMTATARGLKRLAGQS
jgi:glycosyltransferase involved in cell wall biosynthesis